MELYAGARVAARYLVEQKVGEGAFGAVWSAKHISLGIRVALKTLLPAAAAAEETVARFRREARLLAKIQSDYVVRVLDFVHDETFGLVLVLDFIEGELLYDVLRGRRMSVEESIDIGVDVLTGLADLHAAHVIHRDLKPGNILLRRLPDGGQRAVIFDFSLSREDATRGESSVTDLTKSNMVMGTLPYMAPEQALNAREVTERSDVYAVGAVLYRMVSGKQLFGEAGDALLRTKLTTEPPRLDSGRTDATAVAFEEIVARAIRRRPAQRFASAREMLVRLVELQRASDAAVSGDEEMVTELMDASGARLSRPASPAVRAPATASAQNDDWSDDQQTIRLEVLRRRALPGGRRRALTALLLVAGGMILVAGGAVAGSVWTAQRLADARAQAGAPVVDAAVALASEQTSANDASSAGDVAETAVAPLDDGGTVDLDLDAGTIADRDAGRAHDLAARPVAPPTTVAASPRLTPRAVAVVAPPTSTTEPSVTQPVAISDAPFANVIPVQRPSATTRPQPARALGDAATPDPGAPP